MYRYIGADATVPHDKRPYLPDIPARDIKDEEAKERGWEEALQASALYERESVKTKAKEDNGDD